MRDRKMFETDLQCDREVSSVFERRDVALLAAAPSGASALQISKCTTSGASKKTVEFEQYSNRRRRDSVRSI